MSRALWALLGLLGACEVEPAPTALPGQDAFTFGPVAPPAGALRPGPTRNVVVDPPLRQEEADHPTRWVGALAQGAPACPPAFSGFAEVAFAPAALQSPALRRFCVYESSQPFLPGPAADPAFFTSLQPDRMVLAAEAPRLGTFIVDDYATLFLEASPRAPTTAANPARRPRLAVLDTTPTRGPAGQAWRVVPREAHGFTMTNIARVLTCDAGKRCLTDVSSQLAMELYRRPNGDVDVDTINGGDFGSQGGLALAVLEEVAAWLTTPADEPLVINLSLGWHPEAGGDPAVAWPAPVQLVHAALVDAACRGAIVVAASGNRSGGPTSSVGPMYPGAWEVLSLTATDCAARVGGQVADYVDVSGRPPVYAAGGVTEDGVDLALMRQGAQPARVAYAQKGTVRTATGRYAPMMTGTSVGSVVVASAVASVWSQRPDLDGHSVMDLVTASGVPVDLTDPWFCGPGGCSDSHMVSVCGALQFVCDPAMPGYDPAHPCPHVAVPVTCPAGPPTMPALSPTEEALLFATSMTVPTTFVATHNHPACGGGSYALVSETPWMAPAPCPSEQFYETRVQPWVEPQPTHERCPPCFLNLTSGKLYLEWTTGFPSLNAFTLTTVDPVGAVQVLAFDTMPVGKTATYLISPALVASAQTAWVTGWSGSTSYIVDIDVVP